MNIRNVAGVSSTQQLYEMASSFNVHVASMDSLVRFAIALQSAALTQLIAGDGKEQALQRMHDDEVDLGLDQQFWDTSK
jgi:hypothetical protein